MASIFYDKALDNAATYLAGFGQLVATACLLWPALQKASRFVDRLRARHVVFWLLVAVATVWVVVWQSRFAPS